MQARWMIFLIVMAFDAFIMAAVITKFLEVRRATQWLATPGKITASRAQTRKVEIRKSGTKVDIVDHELRTFATVAYAFTTPAGNQQGNRISVAHDVGNYQVAEKLARYPKGQDVTVYYDPANPKQSVLERDMDLSMFHKAIAGGVIVAAIAIIVMMKSEGWIDGLGARLNTANASAALFVTFFAIVTLWFGVAVKMWSSAAKRWPRAKGVILDSKSDAVRARFHDISSGYSSWSFLHRNRTIYSYEVAGVPYITDQLNFGNQMYATFRWLARWQAAKYAAGQEVEVFHDPNNPAKAVLDTGTPGLFLIWGTAAVLFGFAAALAGLV